MKIIFVSGAYRNKSEWGLWQNIQHASEVARRLWLLGWVVICPHRNTAFFGGEGDEEHWVWLKGDLEILKRCDAIYMLNNWKTSYGARCEFRLAGMLGLEIHYEGK